MLARPQLAADVADRISREANMVTTSASHPSRRIGRARPRAAALVIVLSSLGVSIGPAQQSYGDGSKRSEDIAAAGRVSPASERSSPMHGASEPAASTASTASRASIAAATDTAALPTWAAVSVIGAPGTFGSLAADRTNGLDVVPVEGWGFLPGQAAYFTAVDRAGRVIIANEPQTDIQPRPTGDGMVFSTFDPDTRTFVNHRVPTSVGSTTTSVARLAGVGGADIADLEVINTLSGEQLVFTSMSPYGGWDPSTDGVYPSLSILNETRSGWSPEIGQHYTAAELETAASALSWPVA